MKILNDGGPAFPSKISPDKETVKELREISGAGMMEACELLSHHGGMSLRDLFAALALPNRLTHYEAETAARKAYEAADAMLKAREVQS